MEPEKKPYVEGFEELLLGAVYKLGNEAYGVPIWETLQASGRKTALGTIYAGLERLEEKGFVKSRQGQPTQERGGRAKKYFEITGTGIMALEEAAHVRQAVIPKGLFGIHFGGYVG